MYTSIAEVKKFLSTPYPADNLITAEIERISRLMDSYTGRYRLWSETPSTRKYRTDCGSLEVDNFIFDDTVEVKINGEPTVNYSLGFQFKDSFSLIILNEDLTFKDVVEVKAKFGVVETITGTDIQALATAMVAGSLQPNNTVAKETIGKYSVEYSKDASKETADSLISVPLLDKYKRLIV